MSTLAELYAPRFMHGKIITVAEQETMARELGADSLFYLPLDAIARCIRLPEGQLCRACLTGEYPTEAGTHLYQLALRKHGDGTSNGRTYESKAATGCG
jgi:amidophosphoribosyltransferase